MTKFILMLATVFGLSVIAQGADPSPSASPKAKSKSAPAASPSPKAKSKSSTTQHHKQHKIRQQHQMTGS